MKYLFTLGICFLSGCISLFPTPSPRPKVIPLTLDFSLKDSLQSVSWSLEVDKPLALDPYDSKRLMIKKVDEKKVQTLQPLAGIEWNDRLPLLVKRQIIYAFEKSGKIVGVGSIEEDFNAHYLLQSEIKSALIMLTDAFEPKAYMEISAKLISKKDHHIIAQRTFKQQFPIAERSLNCFINAYQKALSQIIDEIIIWTLNQKILKI